MSAPRVKLELGAMSPRIGEQLAAQGLSIGRDELLHFQRDAEAITRLVVRQYISGTAAYAARRKLIRKIALAAKTKEPAHG